MKPIRLHTPMHMSDNKTTTEFDAELIHSIKSIVGDDDREATNFYVHGSPEKQFCSESPNKLRNMIEEAKAKEEVQLGVEAVGLLTEATSSGDGLIHFIEGDGFLGIVAGKMQTAPLRGRERSKYEAAKSQLSSYNLMTHVKGDVWMLTDRGYAMADTIKQDNITDKPFSGMAKLPPKPAKTASITHDQVKQQLARELVDATKTNKVFIVHGHDEEMKLAADKALKSLQLTPIILHEQANEGKTVIEKFEKHAEVGFAVVLLSPDDWAHAKDANPKTAKYRARQNVILELGYFVAKLGRGRVFPLYRTDVDFETPSDIAGVVYNKYDGASGKWRFDLVKELNACGYKVDANRLV